MTKLREELYMQMRSIHSRYDCVRKVMILQRLWCDWTYSDLSNKAAQKTISR